MEQPGKTNAAEVQKKTERRPLLGEGERERQAHRTAQGLGVSAKSPTNCGCKQSLVPFIGIYLLVRLFLPLFKTGASDKASVGGGSNWNT